MESNAPQSAVDTEPVAAPAENLLLQSLRNIAESNRTVQWDTCCRYTTTEDEDDA